jgi:hypothetical protein
VVAAAGLIVALAAVGSATGYLPLPRLSTLRGWFEELPEPDLALEGLQAVDEPLAYSLRLFSYSEEELPFAREMQAVLERRLPNLLFSLVRRGGQENAPYLLLAGPARSVDQAEELRGPLAEVLDREDPFRWSVVETPRAFFLGERRTLGGARALLVTFEGEGVDPYILRVTYPDGSNGYRVLAGAFVNAGEARGLQRRLQALGVEDPPLIERRGTLPE